MTLQHPHRLYNREVGSETSMSACALYTEEDAVRWATPAGFRLSAIHACAV